MSKKTVIVGYYDVPGYGPDSVETPVVGSPRQQYERLSKLIRKRHPHVTPVRLGSVIETRTPENEFVTLSPGTTILQIFADEEGDLEPSRTVGKVFYNSSPMTVVLLLSRSGGYVTVSLSPILRSDAPVRFTNKLNPTMLAKELPRLIQEILGNDGRDLKLNFRESKP